jgi:hypothetical protein
LFVVYCAGPHCNGANKAAVKLAALGYPVKEMIGGVTGWLDEGFQLERYNPPKRLVNAECFCRSCRRLRSFDFQEQKIAACGAPTGGILSFSKICPTAFAPCRRTVDPGQRVRRCSVSICRLNTIYPVRAAIDCRPLRFLLLDGHDRTPIESCQ